MSALELEVPVSGVMPPASAHGLEEDDEGCTTPTATECRIPTVATECPPAPRKPRKEASFRALWSDNSKHIDFFVPPELETVFTLSYHSNPSPLLENGAA